MSITEQLLSDLRADAGDTAHFDKPVPNCLVVEDDPNDADLTSRALEAMGAEVTIATTGEEAIERLRQSTDPMRPDYQIVFLDLQLKLSTLSGREVLHFIREHCAKVHVVIVSGHVDKATAETLSKASSGYIGIIQKPLEKMDVKEIFAKHRLH